MKEGEEGEEGKEGEEKREGEEEREGGEREEGMSSAGEEHLCTHYYIVYMYGDTCHQR